MIATKATTHTARKKRHVCDWCGQLVEIGEQYEQWHWFDDGDAGTVRMHTECERALQAAAMESLGHTVEFSPGDNPRGCWCGHDRDCERCHHRSASSNSSGALEASHD